MHPKSLKWLEDIIDSCAQIDDWTSEATLAGYSENTMLRAAVERSFEIIGEALVRLERVDPKTAASISDYRQIIGFRNRLAHNYDDTDHQQVWKIIHDFLPILRQEAEHLLAHEFTDSTDR